MLRFVLASSLCLSWIGATHGSTPDAPASSSSHPAASVVDTLCTMLVESYVDESVAREMSATLRENLARGEYAPDKGSLSALLTDDLYSISHDKHLRVWQLAQGESDSPTRRRRTVSTEGRRESPIDELLGTLKSREASQGFRSLSILDGNVGYVDLRKFSDSPHAVDRVDAMMHFFEGVDALILDLGQNPGGTDLVIRHLSAYLFAEPTHLVSTFTRGMDAPRERWTAEAVTGVRRPDLPVYVLTSRNTFSAAESFTFGLKVLHRITIVGERTGGGGHFGGTHELPGGYTAFIPVGRTYDPRTGEGWEARGIEPHVEVPYGKALPTALGMARREGEEYRTARVDRTRDLLEDIRSVGEISGDNPSETEDIARATLEEAYEDSLLDEHAVNLLGCHYLEDGNLLLATAILESNVEQFPDSSNAWDSLGHAYLAGNKPDQARACFQESLQRNPQNSTAATLIAQLESEDRDEADSASQAYEQAVTRCRKSDEVGALSALQTALKADPTVCQRALLEPAFQQGLRDRPEFRQAVHEAAIAHQISDLDLAPRNEPGEWIEIEGRTVDQEGKPRPRAIVRLFATDAKGRYHPVIEGERVPRLFATVVSDENGCFRFGTVRPGAYPGTRNARHVHVAARSDKLRLAVPGYAVFDDDPLLAEPQNAEARGEAVRIKMTTGKGVSRGTLELPLR